MNAFESLCQQRYNSKLYVYSSVHRLEHQSRMKMKQIRGECVGFGILAAYNKEQTRGLYYSANINKQRQLIN